MAADNGDTKINNSKMKENSEKYTKEFDPNEISLLRYAHHEQAKEGVDSDNNGSQQVHINVSQTTGTDDPDSFVPKTKGKNKLKGTYEAVLTHLDLSQKARIPFLILTALCAILLIVLIVMTACWPRIPFHMTTDVCVDRECMEASSQILLWANASADICNNPYAWACGKFQDEYLEHLERDSFGITGGEWNLKARADDEEISKIHSFITRMPSPRSSYLAQSMLKGLYTKCMASQTMNKQQSDTELNKAIFSILSWVYDENWQPDDWDFREAMTTIQSKYGVFPFFKLTVENRNSPPFGNIIRISEGEYGLPHKMFYNLEMDHKIIKAYKLLLRDFAIKFGVASDLAIKFADEVFHFEKRVVNSLPENREQVILSLEDAQKIAPSLPIMETVTATFHKLNDKTLILLEDVKLLSELSMIVSTTDKAALNNFLTWSLSRHFLPFMSREYRASLQEFNSNIYGIDRSQPTEYFCSKLLRDWMPFAVDGLRQNQRLIVDSSPISYTTICKCISIENNGTEVDHTKLDFLNVKHVEIRISSSTKHPGSGNQINYNSTDHVSDFLVQDRTNYNHELIKMIFYHLRHQLKRSIDENVSIDLDITNFITDKLSKIELQIGIPSNLLEDSKYLNKFYKDFYWEKSLFLPNLVHNWSFKKKKMELMLEPMNITDKTIANLFSVSGANNEKFIQYSIDLNTIIVSNRAAEKPFFHYKYPISVNFARIGVELSKSLLEAVFLIGEQYKHEFYETHKLINRTKTDFSLGDTSCLAKLTDNKIPQMAKNNLISDVTSGRFIGKCLKEFLHLIETNQPIPDAHLPDAVTYDLFDLNTKKRQPGLRQYDEMQLFSLVYMQRYCSVTNGYYKRFKSFVENEIPGRDCFDINWNQNALIKKSLECSLSSKQCEQIV